MGLLVGFGVMLAVSFISEFGEAVYLSVVRFWYGRSEFLWLGLCGWLCHGPYGLCMFMVCV